MPRFAVPHSLHCHPPLPRSSHTPQSAMAITSHLPLLRSLWALFNVVVSIAPSITLPSFDFRPTFVGFLFDFCSQTSIHGLLSANIRPSPFIFNTIFFKPYLVLYIATKFWGMGQHNVLR